MHARTSSLSNFLTVLATFGALSAPSAFASSPTCRDLFARSEVVKTIDVYRSERLAALSKRHGFEAPPIIEIPLTHVSDFLPEIIDPLATNSTLSYVGRVARRPLYQVIGDIHKITPSKPSVSALTALLKPKIRYNYVVLGDRLAITRTERTRLAVQLTKHFMLAGHRKDVRYAGEIWLEDGVIHINNDSGSFTPASGLIDQVADVLRANFGVTVETHPFVPAIITAKTSDETFGVLTQEREFKLEKTDFKATNEIYFAIDRHGTALAVFKRDEVTKTLNKIFNEWDLLTLRRAVESKGLTKRSIVASDVSMLFGFDFVPVTVSAKDSKERQGSLQEFLAGYKTGDAADRSWIEKISRANLQAMYLYDTLLGMADRHDRNWMVNADGDLKLIDTDHILYAVPKIRWRNEAAPVSRASGSVDARIAAKFLAVTPDQLAETLRYREIPEVAIELATARLLGMQDAIKRGASLESIRRDYSILAVIDYNKLITASVIGIGAALVINHECAAQPPNPLFAPICGK